ncbi:MAG: carboxymuconolactone decarboxylase family protein [Rhodomicrobium sp.]
MSRVRSVPSSELPPESAAVYEKFAQSYGQFRNQVAVFAHVPSAMAHMMGMLMELKAQRNINWRYIELAIVTVSKLNQCDYCVAHHTEPLMIEGMAGDAVGRLPEYKDNPGLDDIDRLVVEYTIAVTTDARRVSDSLFARLRNHFSEAEIVELTLRIALAGFFNRFNEALRIDDELAGPEVPSRPRFHFSSS